MNELLATSQRPELPRFNGWRYLAMVTLLLSVFALPFVGLFFYQLTNSPVNVAEAWIAGGVSDVDTRKLLVQVRGLQRDTAVLGKRLRAAQIAIPKTIEVSNAKRAEIRAFAPFAKTPAQYTSYCAWATDAMRYYRAALADTYTQLGVPHNLPRP